MFLSYQIKPSTNIHLIIFSAFVDQEVHKWAKCCSLSLLRVVHQHTMSSLLPPVVKMTNSDALIDHLFKNKFPLSALPYY